MAVKDQLAQAIEQIELDNLPVNYNTLIEYEKKHGRTHSKRDIVRAFDEWRDRNSKVEQLVGMLPFDLTHLVGLFVKKIANAICDEFIKHEQKLKEIYEEEIKTVRQARDGILTEMEEISNKLQTVTASYEATQAELEKCLEENKQLKEENLKLKSDVNAQQESLKESRSTLEFYLKEVGSTLRCIQGEEKEAFQASGDQ